MPACTRACSSLSDTFQGGKRDTGSPLAAAQNEVLRLAAELYTCTADGLPRSIAGVRQSLDQLADLAGVSGVEQAPPDSPGGSQSSSLSGILSVLGKPSERDLALDDQFPIDHTLARQLVSDFVTQHESEAENVIDAFSTEAGTKATAFVEFQCTSLKVSAIRMAAFTGRRFLYSSCAPSESAVPDSASVPSLGPDGAVNMPECSASAVELFLKLVRGQPPETVSLRDAVALFPVIEYSMAGALHKIWIQSLLPMVKQLPAKQTAFIVACILKTSLCSCLTGDSPLSLFLVNWKLVRQQAAQPSAPEPANRNSGSGDDTGHSKQCLEAAVFASRLLARAGSGSAAHFRALLRICRAPHSPVWLRMGSIAATACCVQRAHEHMTRECCLALQQTLSNTVNVDYSSVFADACSAAPHLEQRRHLAALMAAMVEHAARENNRSHLWFTSGVITDSHLLAEPVDSSSDAPLICLPIQRSCFLLCARVRCTRSTTLQNRNWALTVNPCAVDAEKQVPPHVPHVGLYLHNALDHARIPQFVLGFMLAADSERVLCVLQQLRAAFEDSGFAGVKTAVVCDVPLFVGPTIDGKEILALSSLGWHWMLASQEVYVKWQEMAGEGWRDSSVIEKEIVAFCFLEESSCCEV